MKILVTGAAGFIASKISYMLAERGDEVVRIAAAARVARGRLSGLGRTAARASCERERRSGDERSPGHVGLHGVPLSSFR